MTVSTPDRLVSARRAVTADRVDRAKFDVLAYEADNCRDQVVLNRKGRQPTARVYYVTYEEVYGDDPVDSPPPVAVAAA